jgi:hypothetical protein
MLVPIAGRRNAPGNEGTYLKRIEQDGRPPWRIWSDACNGGLAEVNHRNPKTA